jgi:DNA polymerase (family 10)
LDNLEVAEVFERIANLLQIQGEPIYRVLAYRRAGESLRALTQPLEELWKDGNLEQIPAVGKAISEKINEILSTGKLEFYERLIKDVPETLLELLEVPDVGPKRIASFWKELGITTLDGLEKAANKGQLRTLPGMGERTEKRILQNIESLKSRQNDRVSIGVAWPAAESFLADLRELPDVFEAQIAGSLRRGRETIGDLDFVIATNESIQVVERILALPEIKKVISHGERKVSVELESRIRAQIWVHSPDRFGSALQFATGSQSHNVKLREFALDLGLSLSEYGFKREDDAEILCPNEVLVYETLGLPWIAPELREDRGEIRAAAEGRLPELVEEEDIKGEVHAHSDWSDGIGSILEMTEAAMEMGLSYLVISDHSGSLGVANGLSIDRLHAQREEIKAVQKRVGKKIKLLQGAEVEILADGRLDYPDSVLAELDFVVASVHLSLRQSQEKITSRYLSAIQNPHVDLIGHLSGRLIGRRDPVDLDLELILKQAAIHGIALEINAHTDRLDLNENHAKRAVELGCLLAITTDAHQPEHFQLRRFGVGISRRAWVPSASVINTWEVDRFLKWVNSRG